ncbi:MAG: TonB-dependent receptor [Desulfobacter sp.]
MKKWTWIAFLLTVWLVPPALAEQAGQNKQTDKESLGEVVVTANRVKESKKEVTASITVITQDEINLSGARDLGELLFKTGNVWVRQYPGALTPVGIRGFRTDTHGNDLLGKVLLLLNGRRAGTGNLAKIRTLNIERVEILRGPASVQYGSAGMGGIVNVITKRGKETPEAFVEAGIGSYDRKEASIGGAGMAGNFDMSGSYSYSTIDDYDTASGETYTNTAITGEETASVNLGYNFTPNNRIGLVYNHYDGNGIGNPGGFSSAFADADDYKDSDNRSADLIYEGSLADKSFSWMARYFNGKDKDHWITEPGASSIYTIETGQQGAQAQLSWEGDILSLTGGMDWLDYDYDTSGTPSHSDYENTAGFLMAKLGLFDRRLIFSSGIRYDDYDVEIGNNEGGSQSTDNFAGNLGLAFQANDIIKLRAAWGQGFVMPAASQLAGSYESFGTTYSGNPDLNPEESRTIEGGVDVNWQAFNASATYFHTDYDDFIETVTTGVNTATWRNVDDGTIAGFEWELSFDMGRQFAWPYMVKPYFKGTFFTTYEDDSDGSDLSYIPESTLNYGLTVTDPGNFTANLNVAYYGKERVTDYNTSFPYEEVEKDGGTAVDLTLIHTLVTTAQYGSLSVKGEILNIFDENIEYVLDYPQAGRTFFIGLRWDY